MPANIALVLCIAFMAVLLVTDRRRGNEVSVAVWLPTIWMMYCGSRPVGYWFDSEEIVAASVDYTEGSGVDRLFLSVLIVIGVSILWRRRAAAARVLGENGWLVSLFLYMAVSIVWSDYPTVSAKRWVRTSGDLVMALLILTEAAPGEAVKTILRRSAFVLLPLSIILIKYFRDIGVAYAADGLQTMWTGVTTQKNCLGYLAMVCGLYFVHSLVTSWRSRRGLVDGLFLILTLWLLGGSSTASSKTSVLGFALGLCVLLVSPLSKLRSVMVLVVLLLGITYASYMSLYEPVVESTVRTLGRDTTLTGRTDIWTAVLDIGPRNPIFGRGYGSFWIGDLGNDVWQRRNIYAPIQQSHNGYIDIYIELGVVGLGLLAGVIWSACQSIRHTLWDDVEYGTLRMVFLAVILVHNVAESSFARPTHLLWFLFLLICTSVAGVSPGRGRTAHARWRGEFGRQTQGWGARPVAKTGVAPELSAGF